MKSISSAMFKRHEKRDTANATNDASSSVTRIAGTVMISEFR